MKENSVYYDPTIDKIFTISKVMRHGACEFILYTIDDTIEVLTADTIIDQGYNIQPHDVYLGELE